MSDSGKTNECCGHSPEHAGNCPDAERRRQTALLAESRQIVFDDGSLIKKHTDGKWFGECGAGMTKMRYASPLDAYAALENIKAI